MAKVEKKKCRDGKVAIWYHLTLRHHAQCHHTIQNVFSLSVTLIVQQVISLFWIVKSLLITNRTTIWIILLLLCLFFISS